MPYTINYTDSTTKDPIVVNDSVTNVETSLSFPGRNQRGYGTSIAENFLHLLENFASSSSPQNPVEGQLWYNVGGDSAPDELLVWDGEQWKSAGGIKKGVSQPDVANCVIGDLWVDTDNSQLYIFTGNWILVGPTFSSGTRTGVLPSKLTDVNKIDQVALLTYINDTIISIYSITEFTPKEKIEGFEIIRPGLNMRQVKDDKGIITNRYWGVADVSANLLIGTATIPSSSFVRKDVENVITSKLNVKNDGGVVLGSSNQLKIEVVDQIGNITHSTPDSSLNLRISKTGIITPLVTLNSNGNVGIGPNNTNPTETLDVSGTATISGNVTITSTENTIDDITGSLRVSGGVVIQKDVTSKGNLNLSNVLTVGQAGTFGDAILPQRTGVYDIGNSTLSFSRVYANNFYGTFNGTLTGSISGNAGQASKLLAPTTFTMTGDVVDEVGFSFDGSTGGNTKTFSTTLSPNFITNQLELQDIYGNRGGKNFDEILVYRAGVGIRKTTKASFFQSSPIVPIGAIFPYAGVTPPSGYLLCDGSEKRRVDYPRLFSVIEYNYGPVEGLIGYYTFRLPDLRGRFVLPKLNMDNGDKVPAAPDGFTTTDSGGGMPGDTTNRITGASASIVGGRSGKETVVLEVTNLPDHKHDLRSDDDKQFSAIRNDDILPGDTTVTYGPGPTASNTTQYLPNSGGVISPSLGTAINMVNPYITMNYIIYAGDTDVNAL
jgi:microcystin-dependent protein